jgi:hypothetical protein
MVVHIQIQPMNDPLHIVIVPPHFPPPPNPNFEDETPEWMQINGELFMFCYACETWVPQPEGTAPSQMTCQECAAVTAQLAAWDAEEDEELELVAGDSE